MTGDGSGTRSTARSADELERRLRVRRALSRYERLLFGVAVVVVVLGAGLTVTTYAETPTSTERETVSTWSRTDGFDHGATVTRENPVFPVGTRLENRSAYFLEITPTLNLSYTFRYSASDGGSLRVVTELRLVRRATAGEGTTLWRTARPLGRLDETLDPGERARLAASIPVQRTLNRTRSLSIALGGSPTTAVVADTRVTGQVNGERVDRRLTRRVTVDADRRTYRLSGGEPARRSFSRTETRVRRTDRGPVARIGGPLVILSGVVGCVALAVLGRRGYARLGTAERRWVEYRADRSEYDGWIHTADLPAAATDLPHAEAASLRDLVDIAVDLDTTVLEEPEGGRFRVLHERCLYVYEAPPRPDEAAKTDDTGDSS